MQRETMEFDVLVVGAGPAGLAAAIRLKQRALSSCADLSVCVIDKAPEPGAHTLSGAVMDPRALDELLPQWRANAPGCTPVSDDHFLLLGETSALRIPEFLRPPSLCNRNNVIIRLGYLVKWLADHAESLGVEIYPGVAATHALIEEDTVRGVATGDMGLDRSGAPSPSHQPGMELRARYTLFAEGSRGHIGKQLQARFSLRSHCAPQSHALGLKELWEVPAQTHHNGLVTHTVGWPLTPDTYGGGFMYHLDGGLVSVGLVVGLEYANPWLSPFREFQRFKTHPAIRATLAGGRRVAYGARSITTGGLQSLPTTVFPGGALVGDNAGFLNPARIKGIHGAIKSGMLAADTAYEAMQQKRAGDVLHAYPEAFRKSWLHTELQRGRNFKPLMQHGLFAGSVLFGIDQLLLRGRAPWTLHLRNDHGRLDEASRSPRIHYPQPDGMISFDLPSSLFLSNVHHTEDQPCHLRLTDPAVPITVNLPRYAAPETRYCPAGVYEIIEDGTDNAPRLQINAQNCLHCKACDIKDPTGNINWTPPQGGEGPIYAGL